MAYRLGADVEEPSDAGVEAAAAAAYGGAGWDVYGYGGGKKKKGKRPRNFR